MKSYKKRFVPKRGAKTKRAKTKRAKIGGKIQKRIDNEDDDKGTYTGEFLDDMRHGKGEMVYTDGHKYIGDWEKDVRQGRGTIYYADGSVYEGDWHNNKCHGKGKITFYNLGTYEGDWKYNRADGIGTYTGCWKDNEPSYSCWISDADCKGEEDPITYEKIPKHRGFRLQAESDTDTGRGKCYDAKTILRIKRTDGDFLGPYTRIPFSYRDLQRRRNYKNRNKDDWEDVDTDSDESAEDSDESENETVS